MAAKGARTSCHHDVKNEPGHLPLLIQQADRMIHFRNTTGCKEEKKKGNGNVIVMSNRDNSRGVITAGVIMSVSARFTLSTQLQT